MEFLGRPSPPPVTGVSIVGEVEIKVVGLGGESLSVGDYRRCEGRMEYLLSKGRCTKSATTYRVESEDIKQSTTADTGAYFPAGTSTSHRRRTIRGGMVTYERKTKAFLGGDGESFGIRCTTSYEELLPDEPPKFTPAMRRDITRKSYTMDGASVDISEIMSTSLRTHLSGRVERGGMEAPIPPARSQMPSLGATQHKMEVEIELVGTNIDLFLAAAADVISAIRGSRLLYTSPILGRVIGFLDPVSGNGIRVSMPDARNLKYKDIVHGAIVGGNTMYWASPKADGVRKLMYIEGKVLWLTFPPKEYNLLHYTDANLATTVIDGELIGEPGEYPQRYIAFDILYDMGKDIRAEAYSSRREYLKARVIYLQMVVPNTLITLETKDAYRLDTVANFFTHMKTVFLSLRAQGKDVGTVGYRDDGVIFTPDGPYPNQSKSIPLKDRVLGNYVDICKWKRREDMTIDFLVHIDPTTGIVGRCLNGRDYITFVGTARYPLLPKSFIDDPGVPVQEGDVVEYAWYNGKFFPKRVRTDKQYPNKLEHCQDNWHWIHNPILQETLMGTNSVLLRKYHNRVKREMYESMTRGYKLLDIGSGKGGDVDKWKGMRAAVLVEPNPGSVEKLRKRLVASHMIDKAHILTTGGQDKNLILASVREHLGTADYVTAMLSMTYFWESRSAIEDIADVVSQALAPGGSFYYMVLDGGQAKVLLDDHDGSFESSGITMSYIPQIRSHGSAIYFSMEGSETAENITEYLTNMGELSRILETKGMRESMVKYANTEQLLPEELRSLSSCYRYGSYRKSSEGKSVSTPLPPSVPPGNMVRTIGATTPGLAQPGRGRGTRGRGLTTTGRSTSGPSKIAPSLPVDATKEIISSIPNLVRIGVLGEGNCMIHAVLAACNKEYQEASMGDRLRMAREFRRELTFLLTMENPVYRGRTFWETISNGQFPILYAQEKVFEAHGALHVGIPDLMTLLRGSDTLGDEMLQYIAVAVSRSIMVLVVHPDGVSAHQMYEVPDANEVIVICGNKYHYETIAEVTSEGLKTIFTKDHRLFSRDRGGYYTGDFSKQPLTVEEIDESFARIYAETMIEAGETPLNPAAFSTDDLLPLVYERNESRIWEMYDALLAAKLAV